MNLSDLFKKKENTTNESYFGLFLRSDSAVGFIFEIQDNGIKLIAKEKIKYTDGWEKIVDNVDELLAILENETQTTVTQCIFFVYSYFLDETGDIREPYKEVMKQLSKELDLKPLGYIECHEAIRDMLEQRENSPLNGVLLELDTTHIAMYVFKGGKLIHKAQTARTDNVVDDVAELIEEKKDQYLLPSKVIMYGSTTVEKEAAELQDYEWKQEFFIQPPRISVLTTEDTLTGLANTFMAQLDQEMGVPSKHAVIDSSEDTTVDTQPETVAVAPEEPEAATEKDFELQEPAEEPESSYKPTRVTHERSHDEEGDEARKVGFMIGEDVADMPAEELPAPRVKSSSKGSKMDIKMPDMPTLKGFDVKMPEFNLKSKKKIFAAVTVVLVLAGVALAEVLLHQAKVEVVLPASAIEDTFSLKTAPGNGAIVAQKKELTIEDTIATSGQREVGEKAKGTVIVHNFDDKGINLSSGTTITVDNLAFVIDSDISVASASEKISGGSVVKDPGKKEVSATAKEIGTEYNISKDKRLSISNMSASNFFALAKDSFSGGTKKQLKTVAKKDIEQLEKRVSDKAKSMSLDEAKDAGQDDATMLSQLTEVTITDADYSGEVGEEATEVGVKAKVGLAFYFVKGDEMKQEVANRLKGDVPSGFDLDKTQLSYKIDSAKLDKGTVNIDVLGAATAVKKIDKEKVIESLKGKKLQDARQTLRTDFGVEDVKIEDNASPILIFNDYLPFLTPNIEVTFTSK